MQTEQKRKVITWRKFFMYNLFLGFFDFNSEKLDKQRIKQLVK